MHSTASAAPLAMILADERSDAETPSHSPQRPMPAEGEIAARVLAGEREQFEQLVQRHQHAVFFMLRRLLKNQEDAEDLTQETFLLVFRKLDSYRRDLPFRPWVLRIATHLALSRLRQKRPRLLSLDVEDAPLELPDPRACGLPERLDAISAIHRLDAAVGQLPPELATLFHLRYHEELRIEAIADVFSKKPGSIAVALHRLREKLRTLVFIDANQGEQP